MHHCLMMACITDRRVRGTHVPRSWSNESRDLLGSGPRHPLFGERWTWCGGRERRARLWAAAAPVPARSVERSGADRLQRDSAEVMLIKSRRRIVVLLLLLPRACAVLPRRGEGGFEGKMGATRGGTRWHPYASVRCWPKSRMALRSEWLGMTPRCLRGRFVLGLVPWWRSQRAIATRSYV